VGTFYPFGEQKSGTAANEQYKFATYWRDGESGLDYAHHRYYSSTLGRFLSPDPSRRSMHPKNPQSFNRYAYVSNDPVNHSDPSGLFLSWPGGPQGGGLFGDYLESQISGDADPCVQVPDLYDNDVTPEGGCGGTRIVNGGGGDGGGIDLLVVAFARPTSLILDTSYGDLPHPCQQDMVSLNSAANGEATWSSIQSKASKLVPEDGTTSTFLYNDVFANSPNYVAGTMPGYTVAKYFLQYPSVDALTILGGNVLGLSVVFVRPSVVEGNTVQGNTAMLMHEMLHTLGMEDPAIEAALHISAKNGSIDITNTFLADCFGIGSRPK
jgi:RHS repeat-associated protein